MLVSKFLPGLTTVLPPLAGAFGVPRLQFALYDVGGSILWSSFWLGVGYLFSGAIEGVVERISRLGHAAIVLIVAAVVAYLALKYLRRWLFLRRFRVARITPEALKEKLEAGEEVTVIDLRNELDVIAAPYAIPGSRWIAAERLDERLSEIPRDRELILYCT